MVKKATTQFPPAQNHVSGRRKANWKMIPVCLWFVTKNKGKRPHPENPDKEFRDRSGETLFIDARQMGSMIDRTQKELTKEDIEHITSTYHQWRCRTCVGLSIALLGVD